ncbi:MAG: hypothetical protein RTV31_07615 [Candidatus Thorarchaeota archaeon]
MEYLDFLILAVGCLTFFEAARRLDLIVRANRLSENISNRSEDGIQDNCISYKILNSPGDGSKWSPGIGAAISNRPFIIFLLLILALTTFGAVLTLVASYSKMPLLLVAIAFSSMFHSGPDNVSTQERYLETIVFQEPDKMNGHDLRILTENIKAYRSWPWFQLIFGLGFAISVFWSGALMFIGFLVILIAVFYILGSKYSIQKGVFDSASGI